MANEPTAKYSGKYARDYDGHSMGYFGHEYITDGSFADKHFAGFVPFGGDANVTYDVNCGPPALGGSDVIRTYTETFSQNDHACVGRITNITVNSGKICAWYQAGEAEEPTP